MPAISFQEEWLNMLLRCNKQQTTRKQTDRIKVGDICNIYNQQRRRITDKPLKRLTLEGCFMMSERTGKGPQYGAHHYAHFLGKVEIAEVYSITPSEMSDEEREAWARADGFPDFASARCWFEIRNGARWMHQTWTVIRWDGWLERYFEPEE